MTHASDSFAGSFARQDASGESDWVEAADRAGSAPPGASSHHPVFDAFDALGLTGRDVAELAGVTPPTVSKWRSGKARVPGERLAYLTLVLAHLVDEAKAVSDLEAQCAGQSGAWSSDWAARLDLARAHLAYQDVLNRGLEAGEVREGAQTFRAWWASGAAARLQDKRFRPRLDGAADETDDGNIRTLA